MSLPPTDFSGNIERFSGFAGLYDQYRPAPPEILAAVLTRLADAPIPELVVDLGSGTGLSSRYWANRARRVIGIEPTADMRQQALALTQADNITYQEGFSHHTGLPDDCAQIVTCSQSLHWMDPQPTFAEVKRILRSGGVFAAFDYDWPPTTGKWEADQAYEDCMKRVRELEKNQGSSLKVFQWDKNTHLARMQESGCFRYTKEIVLHHLDMGSADRLVGLALSQGGVMTLRKQGFSDQELGLDHLREVADRVLGPENRDWYWSSRVRIGIK